MCMYLVFSGFAVYNFDCKMLLSLGIEGAIYVDSAGERAVVKQPFSSSGSLCIQDRFLCGFYAFMIIQYILCFFSFKIYVV